MLLAVCWAWGSVPAYAAVNTPPAGFQLGEPIAGHAHNDYLHDHPLWDALSYGFTSVEADIYHAGGAMHVGHDAIQAAQGRTLADLYVTPLVDLVRSRGGTVYPCTGPLQLLVDFKDEPEGNIAALEGLLAQYPDVFAHRSGGRLVPGPVQVVVSGARPLATMQGTDPAYTFYDGRTGDLTGPLTGDFMPLISDNYLSQFTWLGVGPMPADQRAKLDAFVAGAHAKGSRVRFWGVPDLAGPARDNLWATLHEAGVDHLNTDDLAGMDAFLSPLTPPVVCPTPTHTPVPSDRPTPTPSATPSAIVTPVPGLTPTPVATVAPTPQPTASPQLTATATPTATHRPAPTPAPLADTGGSSAAPLWGGLLALGVGVLALRRR